MAVETAADLAAFFNTGEFASEAQYYAPAGGAPTPCAIIVGGRGDFPEFTGQIPMKGVMVLVRLSEIAAPARGGRFVVGAKSYAIAGDPVLEEPGRALWLCMTGG